MSDRTNLADFGTVLRPREAVEPILSKRVRGALLAWLTELFAEDELAAVGIGPRKRAIFDGPPGVGKTTLAHHLAARLGLPMVAVRPERLIDRWLGATGKNIGMLFDAAAAGLELGAGATTPVVLFLDEVDAVGFKRKTNTSQGAEDERNAWINTLLQRLEQYDGFLIAATNYGENVDPAIWRRFDMHVTLELPGQFEREQILKRYLSPFGLPRKPLSLLAEGFATASPALMRQFCEGLKRSIIIGPRLEHDMRPAAVFERLVTSVQPHPDLGKPPMWATGGADHARDRAIKALPWPLPLAAELPSEDRAPVVAAQASDNVVQLAGRAP